jgi:flagella basal body P-ring formation protein FlgA
MRLILLTLAFLQAADAACGLLHSDLIYGRDLSARVPGMERLSPEVVIGVAPLPGVERWIHAAEQILIGKRHGLVVIPKESICLRLATRELKGSDFEEAIRPLLSPTTKIEVVDWSRYELPAGELEFTASGLVYKPVRDLIAPALWRGTLKYFGNRRITVWVKLRLSEQRSWVEAARDLKAGDLISPEDMVAKVGAVFPLPVQSNTDATIFFGRKVRRSIAKGALLHVSDLLPKTDVERGDQVLVRVENAGSVISIQARSEQAGALGQQIRLRNPASGRLFQARVDGKGTAVVRLGESK